MGTKYQARFYGGWRLIARIEVVIWRKGTLKPLIKNLQVSYSNEIKRLRQLESGEYWCFVRCSSNHLNSKIFCPFRRIKISPRNESIQIYTVMCTPLCWTTGIAAEQRAMKTEVHFRQNVSLFNLLLVSSNEITKIAWKNLLQTEFRFTNQLKSYPADAPKKKYVWRIRLGRKDPCREKVQLVHYSTRVKGVSRRFT